MLENPEGCYFKLKKQRLVICLRKVGILQAPSLCLLFDSNSQKDRWMISYANIWDQMQEDQTCNVLVSQDTSNDLVLIISKVQTTIFMLGFNRFPRVSTGFNRLNLISIFEESVDAASKTVSGAELRSLSKRSKV